MFDHSERAALNHLIENCRDGERGFSLAAQRVTDLGLRTLFRDLAAQRAEFANELLPHAQRLGGDGARDGSMAGTLHRGLMKLEEAVHHNDARLVGEVQVGNLAAVQAYADALNGPLPPESRDLIACQLEKIEEAQARIMIHGATVQRDLVH